MDDIGDSRGAMAPAAPGGTGDCRLSTITTRECVELLRGSSVGRLGVTDRAIPMILPVRFRVHNDWVVVRTNPHGTMAAAARNSVVAFEVDDADVAGGTGWSVVVVGHASLITGGSVFATLSRLELPAWAPVDADGYLVIKMERVSGRRLESAVESGTGIQK